MSEPTSGTSNTAESGSRVGIQANHVENSQVTFVEHLTNEYRVAPDATPDEKFRVGVAYLAGGVPVKARELIDEAMAKGFDSAEVRFYWVLSMLSKRSRSDLDGAEQLRLDQLPQHVARYADDDWTKALDVVCALLTREPEPQHPDVLVKFDKLSSTQRDLIVHHLDLVLTDVLKAQTWSQTRADSERGQTDNDRLNRIRFYFKPTPARPLPAALPRRLDAYENAHPWWWSGALLICGGGLVWAVVATGAWSSLTFLGPALVLGVVATLTGRERRYRHLLYETDPTRDRSRRSPESAFEKRVSEDISYYAHRYPPTSDSRRWLAESAAARAALWEELVDTYEDHGVRPDGLRWLIGHLIQKMGQDWKAGRLYAHHDLHRISWTTSSAWVLSLAGSGVLAAFEALTMFHSDALSGALVVITTVSAGRTGASWVDVGGEKRLADERERQRQADLEERYAAYSKWQRHLADMRPAEDDMERWLDCDKRLILAEALQVYRLSWQDVIAHAFLQTPGSSYRRARVAWGPSRYSQYSLRLFLITKEGVREYVTELYFLQARWEVRERNNFRFDAISSVRVTDSGASRSLDLTLTNGPSRRVSVRDATPSTNKTDQPNSKELDLDEAGFSHALHVLEGIAAEGKGWLGRGRSGT